MDLRGARAPRATRKMRGRRGILFVCVLMTSACGSVVERDRGPDASTASGGSSGTGATGGILGAWDGEASRAPDSGSGGTNSGGVSAGGNAGVPSTGAVAGDATAAGGATGSRTSSVGAACMADTDCENGLRCLQPTGNELGGGGPANGLCSAACSVDADCAALSAGAVCLGVDPVNAFCFESCTVGDSSPKCHGRLDVGCQEPIDQTGNPVPGPGYCGPICRGDFDCSGKKCDLSTGVCTDTPAGTARLPTGSQCDPNAAVDACAGVCVTFSAVDAGVPISLCSGICEIGGIGCNQDPNAVNIDSACGIAATDDGTTGDAGFCAQLCDCDGDCRYPGFVCQTLPVAASAVLGRKGQCTPLASASGTPVSHRPCGVQ